MFENTCISTVGVKLCDCEEHKHLSVVCLFCERDTLKECFQVEHRSAELVSYLKFDKT